MSKKKVPRDGWKGSLFRRLREERDRSLEWVAVQTGLSAQQIRQYELDQRFPSHRWRDAAALALRINRRDLGYEGATT